MDFKSDPFNYDIRNLGTNTTDVERMFESMLLVDGLGIPLELRTTCFKNIIGKLEIEHMGTFIDGHFDRCPTWVLQQGHTIDVLDNVIFNDDVVYGTDEMFELGSVARMEVEDVCVTTLVTGRKQI